MSKGKVALATFKPHHARSASNRFLSRANRRSCCAIIRNEEKQS